MNKLINKFNHNFYLSNTETCSYLDNKQERKIFTIMDDPGQTYEYELVSDEVTIFCIIKFVIAVTYVSQLE